MSGSRRRRRLPLFGALAVLALAWATVVPFDAAATRSPMGHDRIAETTMKESDSTMPDNAGGSERGDIRNSALYEYAQIVAIAFVIVFGFIRPFILEPYKIPSGSMEDTLLVGDRVLVIKFLYGVKLPGTDRRLFAFRKPQRGDVFVFSPKHKPQTHFIKRVVAVEGDSVQTRGDTLELNGLPVRSEVYVKQIRRGGVPDFPPFQQFLVPFFFERDGLAAAFTDYSRRIDVSVQTRGGEPVALSLPDDDGTYSLRIAQRQHERGHGVPVDVYYQVQADNERHVLTGVLYQNTETMRWHFVDELAPSSFMVRNPDGKPFVVPDGHVFAMGDNRGNSYDSRAWGPVPLDVVKGKAVMIYWSVDRHRNTPWWQIQKRVRFGRIGMRVKSQYGNLG